MQVLVLHNSVSASSSQDQQDTLWQVQAVTAALNRLGHGFSTLPVTLNLNEIHDALVGTSPDVVFNLVESLVGSDRMSPVVPLLLESLRVPFTGSPSDATALSSDKLFAKERLRAAGLPTADWWEVGTRVTRLVGNSRSEHGITRSLCENTRAIIKPVGEHASVGVKDDCLVVVASESQLIDILRARSRQFGRPLFAERFIDGREFNVSMLAADGGVEVLPPAEIDFSQFAPDQLRIVGYNAKWVENSFEYQNTPRKFDFSDADTSLVEQVVNLSRACWKLFGLKGYARVDFRVDQDQQPWILEINSNACLTPEAGFWGALQRAQIPYETAIQRILDEALRE